jgi:hypothetical protein
VRDPYSESSAQPENLTLRDEEDPYELQSDRTLKMRFTDLSLDTFWSSVKEEYPQLSPSNTANSAREKHQKNYSEYPDGNKTTYNIHKFIM